MLLNSLKNFDTNRLNIEELVELASFARALKNEFELQEVDVPEWLEFQMKSLAREIKARNAAAIEKALREARARLETLKTPGQKKADISKLVAQLEKKLAAAG